MNRTTDKMLDKLLEITTGNKSEVQKYTLWFKNPENLREEIEKAILEFIGILGMSKTGLNFIKFDKEKAIISINREMVNQVRASLCIWPKKIEIKKVSGTLKGLSQK